MCFPSCRPGFFYANPTVVFPAGYQKSGEFDFKTGGGERASYCIQFSSCIPAFHLFMGSLIDSLLLISSYESSFSTSFSDLFSSWGVAAIEVRDGVFSPSSSHVLFGQNLDLESWSGDCLAPAPTGMISLLSVPRKCRQSFGIAGAQITRMTPVCSRAADQTLFC